MFIFTSVQLRAEFKMFKRYLKRSVWRMVHPPTPQQLALRVLPSILNAFDRYLLYKSAPILTAS